MATGIWLRLPHVGKILTVQLIATVEELTDRLAYELPSSETYDHSVRQSSSAANELSTCIVVVAGDLTAHLSCVYDGQFFGKERFA